MSLDECQIIRFGVRVTTEECNKPYNVLKWRAELRMNRRRALEGVETDRDRRARENANVTENCLYELIQRSHRRLSGDGRTKIRWTNRIPWVPELWRSGKQNWGFVLFRTNVDDLEASQAFKTQLIDATVTWLVKDSERVQGKRHVERIEDRTPSNASLTQLCWSILACVPSSYNLVLI